MDDVDGVLRRQFPLEETVGGEEEELVVGLEASRRNDLGFRDDELRLLSLQGEAANGARQRDAAGVNPLGVIPVGAKGVAGADDLAQELLRAAGFGFALGTADAPPGLADALLLFFRRRVVIAGQDVGDDTLGGRTTDDAPRVADPRDVEGLLLAIDPGDDGRRRVGPFFRLGRLERLGFGIPQQLREVHRRTGRECRLDRLLGAGRRTVAAAAVKHPAHRRRPRRLDQMFVGHDLSLALNGVDCRPTVGFRNRRRRIVHFLGLGHVVGKRDVGFRDHRQRRFVNHVWPGLVAHPFRLGGILGGSGIGRGLGKLVGELLDRLFDERSHDRQRNVM
mmetsp:Transcript_8147/g.21131  ORF Transcript_8147/g.21131 Transcript_8147/m.21131 type:complete len:335 (+) Transcript_8147:232-1236(+)